MDRKRQIQLMGAAEERTEGYVRAWMRDPEFRAAARRDPRKEKAELKERR